MILWFDKNGTLKETLTYGPTAKMGSTTFKIYAYFDGVDLDIYGSAVIRMRRPDMQGSEYPTLFMQKAQLTYDSKEQESSYFENGRQYKMYLFDFGSVYDSGSETDAPISLLDTAGTWFATITLIGSLTHASNVVGRFSFNVEESVIDGDDEATELTQSALQSNFATALAGKMDMDSVSYMRACDDFETDASNGDLPETEYVVGSIAFDRKTNGVYRILSVSQNEQKSGYVSAEYELLCKIGASSTDVPSLQATFAMIGDALTNASGMSLSGYGKETGKEGDSEYMLITKSGSILTESQASEYMSAMTGSSFVPTYSLNKPQNSILLMSDGTMLRPRFDKTYGLRLYVIDSPLWTESSLKTLTASEIDAILEA